MRCYRQGDVVLREIKAVPKPANFEFDRRTLAYGEQTGHAHRLEGGKVESYLRNQTRYIHVKKTAQLVHEEHRTLTIPPGVYALHIEREYDYYAPIKERHALD